MRILQKAINIFGVDMQLNVAVEEFSELTKEICKYKRGFDNKESIVEEMADCCIMLEQMKMIFDVSEEEIMTVIREKMKKLKENIENEENRNNEN